MCNSWRPWAAGLFVVGIVCAFLGISHAGSENGMATIPDDCKELTVENIESVLSSATEKYAMVEAFAPWCPHCQRFMPEYAKVGTLFNTEPRPEPHVLVAKINCVTSKDLCNSYNVKMYPTLFWGSPSDFLKGPQAIFTVNDRDNPDPAARQITLSAANVVAWISNKLGNNVTLDFDKTKRVTIATLAKMDAEPREGSVPVATSDGAEVALPIHINAPLRHTVDLNDVVKATIQSVELIAFGPDLDPSAKAPLLKYLNLLAKYHPVRSCRQGTREFVAALDAVWPTQQLAQSTDGMMRGAARVSNWKASTITRLLAKYPICRGRAKPAEWGSCKGTLPHTRGFSCGLWQLFHSTSVRIDEHEGAMWLASVRAYVGTFFACDQCQRHFMEASSKPDAMAVQSKHDAVMWMWGMHNRVNLRLGKEELETGGDPGFPKVQWPPHALCPECSSERPLRIRDEISTWNKAAVYSFLNKYYTGVPLEGEEDEEGGRDGALDGYEDEHGLHEEGADAGGAYRETSGGMKERGGGIHVVSDAGWGDALTSALTKESVEMRLQREREEAARRAAEGSPLSTSSSSDQGDLSSGGGFRWHVPPIVMVSLGGLFLYCVLCFRSWPRVLSSRTRARGWERSSRS
eukprot:jgi/Mesvir1/1088/Mv17600-RA.1